MTGDHAARYAAHVSHWATAMYSADRLYWPDWETLCAEFDAWLTSTLARL